MSRFNLSSISRLFSPSGSSRTETTSDAQPRSSGRSNPKSAGGALGRLSPRASHAPSTSSAAGQRPRTALPQASKKKVSWAPDTPENLSLAALMDNECSTGLTKWGMGLKRTMQRRETDDPELMSILDSIERNKRIEKTGMLDSDDSDSDSEIRPASRHPTVDVNAMLRQAGLADE